MFKVSAFAVKGFVALVVLSVLVFGWHKFSTNVLAVRDVASDQIDEMKGQAVRAAEIRVLLQDFGKTVDEYAARTADIDDQAKDAEQELVQLRGEAQSKLAILKQAKAMLSDPVQARFVIGGRTWGRARVSEDAMKRASDYQRLMTVISGKEQALAQLRQGASEAKSNLDKARVAQSKLNDELAGLETRLENAQMLASVRQMMDKVTVPQFGPSTELQTAMEHLRQQVRRSEAMARGAAGDARPAIDYVNHTHEAEDVLTAVINQADAANGEGLATTQPTETADTH